jgi:hypothetical protein
MTVYVLPDCMSMLCHSHAMVVFTYTCVSSKQESVPSEG